MSIQIIQTLDYLIEDFINRRHFGISNSAFNYLNEVGYRWFPNTEIKLKYICERDGDDKLYLREIDYNFSTNIEDDAFIGHLYDYFIKQGYPIDGQDINTEERLLQFIGSLKSDGLDVEKFFKIETN